MSILLYSYPSLAIFLSGPLKIEAFNIKFLKMAEMEGGQRSWWWWLLVLAIIGAIIYGLVRLFASAASRRASQISPTPSFESLTPTSEVSPSATEEPTISLSPRPTRVTISPLPSLSKTPQTGI